MASGFIFNGKEYVLLKKGQWGYQGKPVAKELNQRIKQALRGKCKIPNCRHYSPDNFSNVIPRHICTTCAGIFRMIQGTLNNACPDLARLFSEKRDAARNVLCEILDKLLEPHREGRGDELGIDLSNPASLIERKFLLNFIKRFLEEEEELGDQDTKIIKDKIKEVLGKKQ